MSLFGDPRTPRRNLWGGLLLAVLGGIQVGLTIADLISVPSWPGAHRHAWVQLVLSVLLVFGGVMQFRLGLRAAHFPVAEHGRSRARLAVGE